PVGGFRKNENENPGSLPFSEIGNIPNALPGEAMWPVEFQSSTNWTCKGQIRNWDSYPEYLEGDFYGLKDMNHGSCDSGASEWDIGRRISTFTKNKTLNYLGDVYKFWIAYADVDGFRIDTIKHMEPGAVRIFTNIIHEFAACFGKENFYLIGEITGGRSRAVDIVDYTGLDAALGIDDIQNKMESLAKGTLGPYYEDDTNTGYFNLFNNSLVDGKSTHQWYAQRIVTAFDDHDQVGTKFKYRYCGEVNAYRSLPLAIALNLTTLGIPCIYYGTEQAFNGADKRVDDASDSDAFLRECMFGGGFGSFQSSSKHFFNEAHEIYKLVHDLCALRKEHACLRRGRQYIRQVANENEDIFYFPSMVGGEMKWVIAWSRLFDSTEIVCMINTDQEHDIAVRVTLDAELNPGGSSMQCIYSSTPNEIGNVKQVVEINDRSVLDVKVKAGGILIYKND
ncbi:MAG TPA: alpha-amylase family glycosyl hydrolase, partial [Chitinophagaceae bacterium]|nr:alpha-amylase family glycosyl hydrolase [Chitinophagaceae bacterium]